MSDEGRVHCRETSLSCIRHMEWHAFLLVGSSSAAKYLKVLVVEELQQGVEALKSWHVAIRARALKRRRAVT